MAASLRNTFSFPPLSGPKQIRLVEFNRHEKFALRSRASRLSMSMVTTPLEACPPYRAVSYEWDTAENMRMIEIEGRPHMIRRNLHECLESLSGSDDAEGYLWIDQLCVNQGDVLERNSQVRIMGEIFSGADVVFAWIGPEGFGSDDTMLRLGRFEAEAVAQGNRSDEAGQRLEAFFLGYDGVGHVALEFEAMIRYRRYWSRLWIVQELALAKRIEVYCGHAHCSGEAIEHAIYWLIKLEKSTRWDFDHCPVRRDIRQKDLSLAQAINRHCAASCEDPRDKIFGLTSVIKENERPIINYSASPEKVFTDTCFQLLEIHARKAFPRQPFNKPFDECDLDLLQALSELADSAHKHVNKDEIEFLYLTIWSTSRILKATVDRKGAFTDDSSKVQSLTIEEAHIIKTECPGPKTSNAIQGLKEVKGTMDSLLATLHNLRELYPE